MISLEYLTSLLTADVQGRLVMSVSHIGIGLIAQFVALAQATMAESDRESKLLSIRVLFLSPSLEGLGQVVEFNVIGTLFSSNWNR